MNELTPGTTDHTGDTGPGPVFVSYATADRKQALSVCKALERRDTKCWISTRDVQPGENYQEAIVRSIRRARAMVLVFSESANNSDEIKKELSLASRHRVPVIALRIEDVEPSDAFAYELSTRQWIDAFSGWDRSMDLLIGRIEQISPGGSETTTTVSRHPWRGAWFRRRSFLVAGSLLLAVLIAAGAWFAMRPSAAAAHPMEVRLAGFKLLSADLPATMPDAVSTEIIAAFNQDGAVGVSTASVPTPGEAPAYALDGTIQRDGDTIRVITRMTNERSGATVWSNTFNYDENPISKIPRHIAVDAGNVVRCGLFGASTYHKPLPDMVLRDYMQFCQGHWDPNIEDGRKALVPAQRVVAAEPDFSWGWAAVAGAFWKVAMSADDPRLAEQARESGRQAADRAVAIDGKNSEALWIKSLLIDWHDWIGRESLLKRAVAAQRLDCGCEHHQYGSMLASVGRVTDAVEQLRQANDMLALYVYTPLTLARALVAAGKPEEARRVFDAAIDLAPDAAFSKELALMKATDTNDINALLDPTLPISPEFQAALLKGYRALGSQNAGAKAEAVQTLLALPEDRQNGTVAKLLGALGADHEAFHIAARLAAREYPGPSLFWYPSMRGTLSDPQFPALAEQLGLMNYWKKSQTRPDVCNGGKPPPFCRMIN